MGWLATLGAFFAGILAMVISQLLADEFKAWIPRLTKWLIDRAIRQLQPMDRNRYEEEWQSHINELPGQVSQIITAAQLGIAARRMRPALSRLLLLMRILDVLGASFAIFVYAPVLAWLALIVRLTSSGPILQQLTMCNRSGKEFKIFTFRILNVNQKKILDGNPSYDFTNIGRFMFKHGLNFLPLLFSVLVGDLSLAEAGKFVFYKSKG